MAHWKRNGWIKYSTSWKSVQNLPRHPTRQKHLGIHLDASLTIQTRRRFNSVLPATT